MNKISKEKRRSLLGSKVIDIEILDNGKACIFVEDEEGRSHAIDCTGEQVVINSFSTEKERVEILEEKLSLLAEKLGIDIDKLLVDAYQGI